MKEILKKTIAIFIFTIMLLNSSLLLIVSTAIDAIAEIINDAETRAVYEMRLEKYVNYTLEEEKGVILQANVKTGIEYGEGQESKTIEASAMELNLPKLNDEYPQKVSLIGISSKATNGNEEGEDIQYYYNKENGKIQVAAFNREDEKGNKYKEYHKSARYEYKIILYYGEDCYDIQKLEKDFEISGIAQINFEDGTRKRVNIEEKYTVKEDIGGIVSTSIETDEIYNGYILSNKQNGSEYKTEYKEKLNIDVSYKNLADEITVSTKNSFINKDEQEAETEEIVYKSTRLNKDKILNQLGEEGYLKITNQDEEIIAEINKNTESKEDGTVEIVYEKEITNIGIILSKPENLGNIELENTKYIKDSMQDLNNDKIKTQYSIVCENIIEETIEESDKQAEKEIIRQEIYSIEEESIVEIKDAETRVDIDIDKKQWTNNTQNDVTITATLFTNSEKYNLFKNPVIDIKLPSEVEKVVIGEGKLLYGNGLTIKNVTIIEENDQKIIRTELEGTQTDYTTDSMIEGTHIIIPATIIVRKDINSINTNMELRYTNETSVVNDYEKQGNKAKYYEIAIETINERPITMYTTSGINNSISENNVQTVADTNENIDLTVEKIAKVGSKILNNEDVVYEKQVIKYIVKITNNSDKKVSGIKVEGIIPEGTTYATVDRGTYYDGKYDYIKDETVTVYDFKELNSLEAGETKEEYFEVIINNLNPEEIQRNMQTSIITTVNGNTYEEYKLNNIIKVAELDVDVKAAIGRDKANSFYYEIRVKNNTENAINDVKVTTDKFQKEIKFDIQTVCTDGENNLKNKLYEDRVLKFDIEKIEAGETKIIAFNLTVDNFDEGINECVVHMAVKAQGNSGIEYWSNEAVRTAYPEYVTVVQTSDKEGEELTYEEETEYIINITNKSKIRTYINIKDYLPKGIDGISAEYEQYVIIDKDDYKTLYDIEAEEELACERKHFEIDLTYVVVNKANIEVDELIPAGKTLTIKIKAKAGVVDEKTEVENFMTVSGDYITTKTSNVIKNTILPYGYEGENSENPSDPTNPDNPNDPNNPDNPSTPDDPSNPQNPEKENEHSISGMVWEDSNKNGQREQGEKLLNNITVKLFDAETNSIVLNEENNAQIVTTKDGRYTFTNVKRGKYLVLFEYDTNKYGLTTYQKVGVDSSLNSDVILKEVDIDGIISKSGVTDIVQVEDVNIENIDMGLVEVSVFDLKLEKYVSKIIVSYNGEEKEYNYKEEKLAKVEIPAKQINETEISIEYKIVVTNEGDIDAYVNEVIDYIPEGFNFRATDNSKWAKNGKAIVSKSLTGVRIGPNESKELNVILTKQLDGNAAGTITNAAEIGDYYNTQKIDDKDSEVANNDKKEDDYSEAQVIIGIKTGVVKNTLIIIAIILLIAAIIYISRKIKLQNAVLMIFTLVVMSGVILSNVQALCIWLEAGTQTTYISSDGKRYQCQDWGYPLCSKEYSEWGNYDGLHYYTLIPDYKLTEWGIDYIISSQTISRTVEKSILFNKVNEENIKIQTTNDGYVLVGPYRVGTNWGGSISVEMSVINNGQNQTLTHANTGYFVDGQGNTISNWNVGNNAQFGFYVKLPKSVTKINHINIAICVQDAVRTTISYQRVKWYYCSSLEGNHHGTGAGCFAAWEHSYYLNQSIYGTKACQRMATTESGTESITEPAIQSVTFGSKDITGNIEIKKKDSDSGAGLAGARFTIKGPSYPNGWTQNFSTDGDGRTVITGLIVGNYTITEAVAPNGYALKLQAKGSKGVTVTAGSTASTTFTNRKYGDLRIYKIDSRTNTSLGAGFVFRIYYMEGSTKKYIKNEYAYDKADSNNYTTKASEAKTLTTAANGYTGTIKNLPLNLKYYIEEVTIPSALNSYYEKKTYGPFTLNNNINNVITTITCKNEQIYTDLSGYVYEDIAFNDGKEVKSNGLYKSTSSDKNDTKDKLVQGITVRLMNTNGTEVNRTTTDKDGKYKFTKVKIKELSKYYVQFEYNGLKYTNVGKNLDIANGSKAIEKSADRTNFNISYANITGGNDRGTSTVGYSRNTSGTITNQLTYMNEKNKSSLVQNTGYTVASANGKVTAQNGSVGVLIKADTTTAGRTLDKYWTSGAKEIKNINLGLKEREQPDMAIANDLKEVELRLNGYTHTYQYSNRLKAQGIDIFAEDVKYLEEHNEYPRTYTRSIYKNYVYATGITGEGALEPENKLQIYLIYNIVIKNESASLYMTANEITNYLDDTLDLDSMESWYEINGSKKEVKWIQNGTENVTVGDRTINYLKLDTTSLKDEKIENGKSITINIKVKEKESEIVKWARENSISAKTYNIAEIKSYSTYTKDGAYYAGIDKDSAPDNIKAGQIDTYEDDTDSAPVLEVTLDEPRTISGYVFEDYTDTKLLSGEERQGDGKYNASEDGYVGNVKAELIRLKDNTVAYIYPKAVSDTNFNADKGMYITTEEEKGYYEFVGVIPGEYYLRFTYDDGSVIYKAVGGTTKVTTQDYKSTIITSEEVKAAFGGNNFDVASDPTWYQKNEIKGYSTAVDDYVTRQTINEALKNITYEIKTKYDTKASGYEQYHTMTARTPNMEVAIENTNNEITIGEENRTRVYDHINFGIVERPRQNIKVYKEISYIKITLANGQVLVEGDPRTGELPYVGYPEYGMLKVELDSEITEGATLEMIYEIKIDSNSEMDYNSEMYYKYGDKSGVGVVSMDINEIIDHMDENLVTPYTKTSTGWKLREIQELKDEGLISKEVYDEKNNSNKKNTYTNEISTAIEPTLSTTITIKAGKLLSSADDIEYRNFAEVIKAANEVGRFYGQTSEGTSNKWENITPGNLITIDKTTYEDDNNKDNRGTITIVPPTGENRNILYYIIGISSLTLLGIGIVVIKKKVL